MDNTAVKIMEAYQSEISVLMKDKKAKDVSVVKIVKEIEHHHHHYDRWYEPYRIYWYNQPNITWSTNTTADPDFTTYGEINICDNFTNDCGNFSNSGNNVLSVDTTDNIQWTTINCSVAKNNAIGSYSVGDNVINFR